MRLDRLLWGAVPLLLLACGNATSTDDCAGDEGCACYPNSTCNGALSCFSNLCVNAGGVSGFGGAGNGGATARGGAPAFSAPAKDPAIWYRADQGVVESSSNVSAWRDQSGNGADATATDTSRQPFLVPNAVNGLPVLRFYGGQSLYLSTPFSASTFTVFVAGKNSMPGENYSIFLGPGGNTPNNQLRWEDSTSIMIVGLGNDLPQTVFPFGTTRVYHIVSVRYDGEVLDVARNGVPVGSSRFVTSGPWELGQVGAWFSTYFMQGDLAEMVLYNRRLGDADFAGTAGYLREKYAIQ
ncbi:MAG: hypothetical protein ACOY0T_16590 [Myxococcota bacterium]